MKAYFSSRHFLAVVLLCLPTITPLRCVATDTIKLFSPDGSIAVSLTAADGFISYSVAKDGQDLYSVDSISLHLGTTTLPAGKAKIGKTTKVRQTFRPAVPLKFSEIEDIYNETVVSYGKDFCFILRVYDNAVAYRFSIAKLGDVEVFDDYFRIKSSNGFTATYQPASSFVTDYEKAYRSASPSDWAKGDQPLATIPLLLSGANDTQLLIGESDVDDYPRQFLTTDGTFITPLYPKTPLRWEPRGDRGETILEETPYIAKTSGTRTFPWRWVCITDSRGLLEQTLPVQLARRNTLGNTSWIEPGQVSWEWWNGAAPYGPDVDFKAGCNYDTYCYYADFAARYGLRYILLDEGWAKNTRDPFTGNDDLRLHELISYCKTKGVEVILWLPWLTVEQHLDSLFNVYDRWGVHAVKIDFMNHSDQWMVNFYKRVVSEAAKYHTVVDFHGSFTPAGLEHEYPNLLSYEGVLGLEQMGSCKPDNTLFLPFIRNAVGAADFTPGGMNNMQPEQYRAGRPNSGAVGTRVHQMALYIVLESGLQMLADCPTRYYQADECTRFITSVPVTWDETRALEARAGQYAIVARRNGERWYIGGITNNQKRDFTISLDFLPEGTYRLIAFRDGLNADYQAMHYNRFEQTVSSGDTLHIHLARNGGWAGVLEPLNINH